MTFITLDARLLPTATLCMPGFPPRHVCVAERRVLLTYLLTYAQIKHMAPKPKSEKQEVQTVYHASLVDCVRRAARGLV